jgi:hypothetical protein
MNARWDLSIDEARVAINFQNLWSQETLACGETDMGVSEILDWMLSEGTGGSEVVFVNGKYLGNLMPPENELQEFVTAFTYFNPEVRE